MRLNIIIRRRIRNVPHLQNPIDVVGTSLGIVVQLPVANDLNVDPIHKQESPLTDGRIPNPARGQLRRGAAVAGGDRRVAPVYSKASERIWPGMDIWNPGGEITLSIDSWTSCSSHHGRNVNQDLIT